MTTPNTSCPLCKGKQWTYEYDGEEVIPKRCICLERRLLREYLGAEIFSAKWTKSELYAPVYGEETERVEGDRTQDNLFIQGTWEVVLQHLRWVLSAKRLYSPEFSFRIVTDNNLLEVWLGTESYGQRAAGVRNEIVTFNNLTDLLDDPSLVILRLGFRVRNKALPNVLFEALRVREVSFKPTWIIEGIAPFCAAGGYTHPTYDDVVSSYIDRRFETIDLGGDVEAARAKMRATTDEVYEEGVDMGPNIETPKADELLSLPSEEDLMALFEKRKFKPRFGKKRGSGGGMSDLEPE